MKFITQKINAELEDGQELDGLTFDLTLSEELPNAYVEHIAFVSDDFDVKNTSGFGDDVDMTVTFEVGPPGASLFSTQANEKTRTDDENIVKVEGFSQTSSLNEYVYEEFGSTFTLEIEAEETNGDPVLKSGTDIVEFQAIVLARLV